MDQRLLDALNNLSLSLEEISEALKDKKGVKSDTTAALQSGNFSKTIQEINVGIKSIKKDTQEILKQQKTIIELSKKKTADKKTDTFESDPKKDSSIKKGVTTILLIAVGVLAIGMAFKMVGKIDFLSVVGLGIGIYAVAVAFERIGRLENLSFRKVLMISSVMPLMGMGIWLASQFLSRVRPMSIGQIITSIGIAGAFYFIAPVITSMMDAMMNSKEVTMPGGKKIKTSKFDMSRLKATIVSLPILMIAMALGITMSSWILSGIKPIGLGQIITAIAIAGMFSIAAVGVKGLIHALTEENETKGPGGYKTKKMDMSKLVKIAVFLPIVMMAIALGITLSSYILSGIKPIGLGQAITAILIAGMFAVVSWGISKMLNALKDLDPSKMIKAVVMIPLLLPAIALAIAASSWVLSKIKTISFSQFLTGLAISIMFIAFSVTLLVLAKANLFGKIGIRDVIMIPLIFVAMSTAIMLSSWILAESSEITFGRSLEILAFSVVMCIAVISVAITAKIVTMIGDVKMYVRGGISIVTLASTIMFASLLIDQGVYNKYPGWRWSLFTGLSLVVFGAVSWVLMKIGGVGTYVKGGVAILIVAATIMATSHILNAGNYKKYPSFKWSLSVGLSLALFGVGAVLLGTQALNPFFYAGLAVILLVAVTVVAASHILALGNYKKYPTVKWGLGVGLALGAFGVGAVLLGTQVMNPFFYAGLGMILLVSGTVVAASHILAKGNYKKYPTFAWSSGVGLALSAFGLGAVLLGFNVLNPFFYAGLGMIKEVAQNIVDTSYIFARGKWKAYPDTKWAKGISSLFKAMDPVFSTISKYNGFFGNFDDIISNMIRISNVMISLSKKFANSSSWKYPPLKWGEGVAKNIYKFVGLSNFISNKLDFFAFGSVRSMTSEMVMTAKILGKNAKYFNADINPNFMKNLSSNLKYYIALTNHVQKTQGIGSFLKRAAFGDPMTNMANGMVKLAIAYDRLARSMKNFGSSLRSLDEKKLNQFRGMTSNIAVLSALDSKMFDNMLTVLETRSSVFAKMLNAQAPVTTKRGSVRVDKKGDKQGNQKKGKHGDTHRQMDVLIELMGILVTQVGSGSTLDEFLLKKIGEKKGNSKDS
jgi:hypothetical protein